MSRFIICIFLLKCAILLSNERDFNTKKVDSDAPVCDGVINEKVWNIVEWSGDFTQTVPKEKQNPSQLTKFKIVYDDNFIYVAIRCFDSSPDSIDNRLTRRDNFDGDWIYVSFDSYNDQRTAFSFSVNAAGVKSDEMLSNNGNSSDANWDPVWYVKTNIDTEGWTTEMKIPLTQLRFANKTDYTWGLQVMRRLYRKNEESLWKFKSPKDPGWVNHYGKLYGISNIKPKKQRDITPYVVGKQNSYLKEKGNPFKPGMEYDKSVGVDGKFGLTNDLTLDFTLNPDFGQVEADPSEMNLTTFETKFSEKRPFFIEGNNILNYEITPGWWELSSDNGFYSRRIGKKPSYEIDLRDNEYADYPDNTTILGALKITGKTKKGLSVGMLESVTQKETAEIDYNGERRTIEVEPFTNFFTCRLQQDMNDANTRIGSIITATNRDIQSSDLKNNMHSDAYTMGFDLNHEWKDKKYYLILTTLYSNVQGSKEAIMNTQTNAPHFFQRTDAKHLSVDSSKTSLNGFGGTLRFGSNGNGKWMYSTWLSWRTPGFDNKESGYMRNSDILQQVNWLGYRLREAKGKLRYVGLNFNQWSAFSFGGERLYVNGNFNGHITLTNMWSGGLGFSRRSSCYIPNELRGGPSILVDGAFDFFYYFQSDNRKKVRLYFEHNGERFDNNIYKRDGFYTNLKFRLMRQLDFSVGGSYNKRINTIQYIDNIDFQQNTRYIRGQMIQEETAFTFRFNVYLSPDISIQYYGMPFISAGKFSEIKYINNAHAKNFSDRYKLYDNEQISYNAVNEEYQIDEDKDGNNDYSVQPDFNWYDFNSNLVFRWEFQPGSLIYLVWSQNRNTNLNHGNFDLNNDFQELFTSFPSNVFLIKLSYRFALN